MFSPVRTVQLARAALMLGGVTLTVLLLGPFKGAEQAFGLTDKPAHIIAWYAMTALAFVAAPRMRRNDLALAAVAFALAVEIAQWSVGRGADFTDALAGALGALAAWLPAAGEQVRRDFRDASPERMRRRLDHIRNSHITELGRTLQEARARGPRRKPAPTNP